MWFILILFIVLVGGGWLIGKAVGTFLFPDEKKDRNVFIDKSVHYHEHKHINIIDEATRKSVFELKESEEKNKKASD